MNAAKKTAELLLATLTVLACSYTGRIPATQPSVTPTQASNVRPTWSAPLEEVVIQQTAQVVCFDDLGNPYVTYGPDFYVADSSYGFRCDMATGHTASASLEKFASHTEAQALFLASVEGRDVQYLHDYPFAVWDTEFYISEFGGKTRVATFQIERWVIKATSDDDTHYLATPDPFDVVEHIYERMVDLEMIPPERSG